MQLTIEQYEELDRARKGLGTFGPHLSVLRIARIADRSNEAVRALFYDAAHVVRTRYLGPSKLRPSYSRTFIEDVRRALRLK